MNARRAAVDKCPAQRRHDLATEGAQRLVVAIEFVEPQADPAGYVDAGLVGELHQVRVVGDRHHAGHDGHVDAVRRTAVAEVEEGFGVVEVLGDAAVGARIDLALEKADVGFRRCRIGMHFGIGADFDGERCLDAFADQPHQILGVPNRPGESGTRRHVAAQCHDPVDAEIEVVVDQRDDGVPVVAAPGEVRYGIDAGPAQTGHRCEGAIARRTTGAVGHRVEGGAEEGEPLCGAHEIVPAALGARWEELEADFGH